MNLVTEPWIPVVRHDGSKESVSLNTIFSEGKEIRDLSVNPPQRIALMRLLICITQAALDGPEDTAAWINVRETLSRSALNYLHNCKETFALFGDSAFLQAQHLELTRNAALDKLDFGLAAGNNATLFDHEATAEGRQQTAGWTALNLLTYQCFSPGGLVGVASWNGSKTSRTSEHAPCIEGSALHTILIGANIEQTIWLNLISKKDVSKLPGMSFGKPVWESGLSNKGNSAARETTQSYLGRLVPFSRAIKIEERSRSITLVNGLSYPKIPSQREPNATVIIRGKGQNEKETYIQVRLDRHPWRELASVLSITASSIAGGAMVLGNLQYAAIETVDVWTGGMAADKGKILDVGEWIFSIRPQDLTESWTRIYSTGAQLAERGEYLLKDAIKEWYKAMINNLDPKQIPYASATSLYWSELDKNYEILINCAQDDISLNGAWYTTIRTAMEYSLSQSCPHKTPRQIQAFAKAKRNMRLKKIEE